MWKFLLGFLYGFIMFGGPCHGHEYADDQHTKDWFETLMQPDNPFQSCCGEADAYQADDFEVVGGHVVATITDGRDDLLPDGRTRRHIPPGTRVVIPDDKVKWDKGNPTGHGYIFIGRSLDVYCYVAPAGA